MVGKGEGGEQDEKRGDCSWASDHVPFGVIGGCSLACPRPNGWHRLKHHARIQPSLHSYIHTAIEQRPTSSPNPLTFITTTTTTSSSWTSEKKFPLWRQVFTMSAPIPFTLKQLPSPQVSSCSLPPLLSFLLSPSTLRSKKPHSAHINESLRLSTAQARLWAPRRSLASRSTPMPGLVRPHSAKIGPIAIVWLHSNVCFLRLTRKPARPLNASTMLFMGTDDAVRGKLPTKSASGHKLQIQTFPHGDGFRKFYDQGDSSHVVLLLNRNTTRIAEFDDPLGFFFHRIRLNRGTAKAFTFGECRCCVLTSAHVRGHTLVSLVFMGENDQENFAALCELDPNIAAVNKAGRVLFWYELEGTRKL